MVFGRFFRPGDKETGKVSKVHPISRIPKDEQMLFVFR